MKYRYLAPIIGLSLFATQPVQASTEKCASGTVKSPKSGDSFMLSAGSVTTIILEGGRNANPRQPAVVQAYVNGALVGMAKAFDNDQAGFVSWTPTTLTVYVPNDANGKVVFSGSLAKACISSFSVNLLIGPKTSK